MKDAPKGWPRITTTIHYKGAKNMIDWLCPDFGLEVQMVIEGESGNIEHRAQWVEIGGVFDNG